MSSGGRTARVGMGPGGTGRPSLALALGAALVALLALLPAAPARADGPVDWDAGSGPAAMARGLPSPPGWYRAAMGPRTTRKVLYLTFDDGPFPARTPRLLRLLDHYGARATFFLMGTRAADSPGLVRRIAREGHAIGNHTLWHPRLTDLSSAQVRAQLRGAARSLGRHQGPCMRPPFGLINARVARVSLSEGLQPIMWTGHIEDWNQHSTAWHVERLRRATAPGAIILMHDSNPRTMDAVARMLPVWRNQGYSLRALPPCRAR